MSKKKTKKTKRPKFTVGPVKVRAARGPRDDGAWYWRAVRYIDGSEHTLWTGWATQDVAMEDISARVASGDIEPVDKDGPMPIPRTVRDLLETWMFSENQRADIKEKTKQVTHYYARQVAKVIGHVALRQMQYLHLEQLRDERIAAGAAPNVVQHEIRIMRRAWQWGVNHRYCPDRTLPRPRLKVRPRRHKRTPSIDEVQRTLAHMDTEKWPFLAVLIIAETGMRVGEVAGLHWKDVELDRGIVHVPDESKTGWRSVPISEALTAFLGQHRGDAPDDRRVLPVGKGTVLTSLSQRYIPKACKAAKVHPFTPHGIRRMVVDALYNSPNSEPTLNGAFLGQSPQTAQRYYRSIPVEMKRSAKEATGLGSVAASVLGDGD